VLGAQRQEDRAIGQAEHRDEHRDRQQVRDARRRRDQRAEHQREQRDVQPDVEPGPPGAAEHGQAGEHRLLGGAGAHEVQHAADRREVAAGQRPEPAAQAEPLEHHAPQDRLLERDRRPPPPADRGQTAELRRAAAEHEPDADEQRDLEHVDDVDQRRGAVALQRPRLAHHPRALGERPPDPVQRIIGHRHR
jgi:hypothetical protein